MERRSLISVYLTKIIRSTKLALFLIPFFCLTEKSLASSETQPSCEQKTVAEFCFDCKIKNVSGLSVLNKVGQALHKEKLSEKAQYITNSMSSIAHCPDRIWPDLILTQKPYIILDKSNNTANVVTHDECGNPSYRPPTSSELTEDHLKSKSPYNVTSINGKDRVIIRVPESPSSPPMTKESSSPPPMTKESLFGLLVHEAFHVCDQFEHWKIDHALVAERFSRKTKGCDPRKHRAYIRYYLEEALKADVNSKAYKRALQKASWWNQEYKNKYPEEFEAVNVTDTTEGSAEFVSVQARALLEKGCQAKKEELNTAYTELYFKGRGNYQKVLPAPDIESYFVGSLASALLERSSSPKWQEKVTKGASPVQLLLKESSALKSTKKIQEIEDGCRFLEEIERGKKLVLKNIKGHLDSEDYVALSITYTRETSKDGFSMTMGSMAAEELEGYNQALLGTGATLDTGESDIAFSNVHLLRPDKTVNKCGKDQIIILIPREAVSVNKEDSSISEINFSEEKTDSKRNNRKTKSSINGKVTVTNKIEKKGADIWCAK